MDERVKSFLERSFFGVFTYLGERFGLPTGKLRLYFIYVSFLTLGSPVLFYVIAAFWLNLKRYLRNAYTVVFD
jgi:phage shock protein PspC (stress-responsive transcriptional regulator)